MERTTENIKNKLVLRLFPYLKQIDKASKLLIDDESIRYISKREYAEKISDIIKLHLETLCIYSDTAVITDATAGVGGDTISFSHVFHKIYSIEINEMRAKYLKNNIQIYDCHNVTVINDNCFNVLNEIPDHNVIFIDPPWETADSGSYKKYTDLLLNFCGMPIEQLCNQLMNTDYMKKKPEIIALKLPKNYNITHFYKHVNNKNIVYYNLNKMIILIIINSTPLIEYKENHTAEI